MKRLGNVLEAIKKLSAVKPSLVTTDNIRAAIDAQEVTNTELEEDAGVKEAIYEASQKLINSINNMFNIQGEVH